MALSFSVAEPLDSTSTCGNTATCTRECVEAGVYSEIAHAIMAKEPHFHVDMRSQTGELLRALQEKRCHAKLLGVEECREKALTSIAKLAPALLLESQQKSFRPAESSVTPENASAKGALILQEDYVRNPRNLLHVLRRFPIDSVSYVLESMDGPLVSAELQAMIAKRREAICAITHAYMAISTQAGGWLTRAEHTHFRKGCSIEQIIPVITEHFRHMLEPYWTDISADILTSDTLHNTLAASELRMGRFDPSRKHGVFLVQGQRTDHPCAPNTIFKHFHDVQCGGRPL